MNMTEQAEEEPLVVLDRAGLYCPGNQAKVAFSRL
jgi:hypothetical protein